MSSDPISSIKIVDGVLILSFPEAETPVVWRMKLEDAALAAFEVQKNDKGGKGFFLHLKTSDDKSENIALFETKKEAVKALMDVTEAMEKTPVSSAPAPAETVQNTAPTQAVNEQVTTAPTTPKKRGILKTTFMAILFSGLLILALMFLLMKSGPSYNTFPSQNTGESPQSNVGTPLSADDFLNQR